MLFVSQVCLKIFRGELMKVVFILISIVTQSALARPISNEALFRRCYGLITQSYPDYNHPLLNQIRQGTLEPITGCLQVFDKAKSNSSGQISNTNDQEAREVLNSLQSLHYSWLSVKDFVTSLPSLQRDSTRDLYDVASGAYYFTKAAFDNQINYRDIFTQSTIYGAIRTNMNPSRGIYTNTPIANWLYTGGNIQHVPSGDLIGIRPLAPYSVTQGPANTSNIGPTLNIFNNLGGGVLGSAPYVTHNVLQEALFSSNASSVIPRKWSRSLIKDFMCRDLPVIRDADAARYVSSSSSIAFRTTQSCTRCHATMDQMGATIRNATLTTYENGYDAPVDTRRQSASIMTTWGTNATAETEWPINTDYNYFRRPTKGRLVFRTFDGQPLIDEEVANATALGTRISQLDDPYVCLAKRYYQYFMGVDIRMTDFNDPDPAVGHVLTPTEQKHWNKIVTFGRNFKQHQKVRLLIEEILRGNGFKESDFNVQGDKL